MFHVMFCEFVSGSKCNCSPFFTRQKFNFANRLISGDDSLPRSTQAMGLGLPMPVLNPQLLYYSVLYIDTIFSCRFSSVAKEVLAESIPSQAYDCYILLCDAVRMLYSEDLQISGWKEQHIARLEKLLWSHAIRAEEFYGLAICTENLEYSVHVALDIRRHSSMDNYSCELYERAILRHKAQKHNAKGLEKTFAERESLRNFLDDYKEKKGPLSQYGIGNQKYMSNFITEGAVRPLMLQESSFTAARALIHDIKKVANPSQALQHALSFGVVVGQMKRCAYPEAVIADIRRYFRRHNINFDEEFPNLTMCIKTLALQDELGNIKKFVVGTLCKIASQDGDVEWIVQISDIVHVGPINGNYFIFINGKYFIPTLENGSVIQHPWTQTAQLIARDYVRDSVQPSCQVKRKVILYLEPSNLHDPAFHLCIDFEKPELAKDVSVPIYPNDGDTVQILGVNNVMWYGIVRQVNSVVRKFTVQWYAETRRAGVWTLANQHDDVDFRSILKLCHVNRVFGGIRIT